MNKIEFLNLMKYPNEWIEWDRYPEELANLQISQYELGNEMASEHDRFSAFIWWLSNYRSKSDLETLLRLADLDVDKGMADDARTRINLKIASMK